MAQPAAGCRVLLWPGTPVSISWGTRCLLSCCLALQHISSGEGMDPDQSVQSVLMQSIYGLLDHTAGECFKEGPFASSPSLIQVAACSPSSEVDLFLNGFSVLFPALWDSRIGLLVSLLLSCSLPRAAGLPLSAPMRCAANVKFVPMNLLNQQPKALKASAWTWHLLPLFQYIP